MFFDEFGNDVSFCLRLKQYCAPYADEQLIECLYEMDRYGRLNDSNKWKFMATNVNKLWASLSIPAFDNVANAFAVQRISTRVPIPSPRRKVIVKRNTRVADDTLNGQQERQTSGKLLVFERQIGLSQNR